MPFPGRRAPLCRASSSPSHYLGAAQRGSREERARRNAHEGGPRPIRSSRETGDDWSKYSQPREVFGCREVGPRLPRWPSESMSAASLRRARLALSPAGAGVVAWRSCDSVTRAPRLVRYAPWVSILPSTRSPRRIAVRAGRSFSCGQSTAVRGPTSYRLIGTTFPARALRRSSSVAASVRATSPSPIVTASTIARSSSASLGGSERGDVNERDRTPGDAGSRSLRTGAFSGPSPYPLPPSASCPFSDGVRVPPSVRETPWFRPWAEEGVFLGIPWGQSSSSRPRRADTEISTASNGSARTRSPAPASRMRRYAGSLWRRTVSVACSGSRIQ